MNAEVREHREVLREEMIMRDKILTALREGPKTVPEIAQAVACPVNEVMFWVMSARKYGYLEELKEPTDNGYYEYQLVEKKEQE
jgi:predicted Rossmann fold nucleotide-binding protein DprA/Smf involved in DNA uptake